MITCPAAFLFPGPCHSVLCTVHHSIVLSPWPCHPVLCTVHHSTVLSSWPCHSVHCTVYHSTVLSPRPLPLCTLHSTSQYSAVCLVPATLYYAQYITVQCCLSGPCHSVLCTVQHSTVLSLAPATLYSAQYITVQCFLSGPCHSALCKVHHSTVMSLWPMLLCTQHSISECTAVSLASALCTLHTISNHSTVLSPWPLLLCTLHRKSQYCAVSLARATQYSAQHITVPCFFSGCYSVLCTAHHSTVLSPWPLLYFVLCIVFIIIIKRGFQCKAERD